MEAKKFNVNGAVIELKDNVLRTLMSKLAGDSAESHNAFIVDRDITEYLNDGSLFTRIASGKFEDIYPGNYFYVDAFTAGDLNIPRGKYRIAELNYGYNNGDTALTRPHALIVPDFAMCKARMEATNITTNGYAGSEMHTVTLPKIAEGLESTRLSGHILTYRDLLTNSGVATGQSMAGAGFTGYANNWTWFDTKLRLMNEVMIYGSTVYSSSFYDVGCFNKQAVLFQKSKKFINPGRFWFWLSAVASGASFAHCYNDGYAYNSYASHADGSVRPCFFIG